MVYSQKAGQACKAHKKSGPFSWLVGALSPANHKRLYQGWKQTSIYPLVIHSTSCYTTSLFLSNHNSNHIHSFGTQTQKNKNTCFWSQIIFRGHSTRERFILRSHTGTGFSHSKHRKNSEEVLEKCRWWTWRVEISKEEIPGSRRSMRGYIQTCSRLKRMNLWAKGSQ